MHACIVAKIEIKKKKNATAGSGGVLEAYSDRDVIIDHPVEGIPY